MNVHIETKALLAALFTNRAHHMATYQAAIVAYRERVIEELRQKLIAVEAATPAEALKVSKHINLPIPEEHIEDFDRAIRMLELSAHSTVELTEAQFAQYVLDDWGWKKSFTSNTASYTVG